MHACNLDCSLLVPNAARCTLQAKGDTLFCGNHSTQEKRRLFASFCFADFAVLADLESKHVLIVLVCALQALHVAGMALSLMILMMLHNHWRMHSRTCCACLAALVAVGWWCDLLAVVRAEQHEGAVHLLLEVFDST